MVNVVLLMHKMKIIFYKQLSITNKVTGQGVADEVEDLGFGAELINTFEVQQESEDIQKSAFERKKLQVWKTSVFMVENTLKEGDRSLQKIQTLFNKMVIDDTTV